MQRPTGSPSPDSRPSGHEPASRPPTDAGNPTKADDLSPSPRPSHPPPLRQPVEPSPWLLLGAGIELGGAIILLTLAGWWLDGKLGTEPVLLIVGLALGFVAGFTQLLRQVRRFQQADDARKARAPKPRPPRRPTP